MAEMTGAEFYGYTKIAYLSFIHLHDVTESLNLILDCVPRVSDILIREMLLGSSWRERLYGLVLAGLRDYPPFFSEMHMSLRDVRGLSTVPTAAALSVAITDFDCPYDPAMTMTIGREILDGELGFALDQLHFSIGIGPKPELSKGPNDGQSFDQHRSFYRYLSTKRPKKSQ
ncbi:MAG: hypothetical protein P1V97_02990 [Planctomycetota bacterium]|nr:hypothetical protein [Planctomycetota bacterium]